MRELISLIIAWLGLQIPWSGGFFFAFSFIISISALAFFCLCIVDRFLIAPKQGHRMRLNEPANSTAPPKNPPPHS